MLSGVIDKIYYLNKLQQSCIRILNTNKLWVLPYQKKYYSTRKKIDTSHAKYVGTILDVKEHLYKLMGIEIGYKPFYEPRDHLNQYLPKSQDDLPTRTMGDTFVSAVIPLASNFELQDRYCTNLGNVRIGRLLEDMDLFAAYVAYMHINNPKVPEGMPSPHVFATALVDKIAFMDFRPTYKEDVKLSGHVSWAGKTSIEVVVWVEQKEGQKWQKITKSLFVMVARDATAKKAAILNPLVSTDDEEKKIMEGGDARKQRRIELASQHLTKVIPNAEEQMIMHNLFRRTVNIGDISLKRRVLPEGGIWMRNCIVDNLIISHPEHRNVHNRVFGGFIMRHALELSWGLAFLFCGHLPTLRCMSDVNFDKPIEVNSIIHMQAYVVFTYIQYFEIIVYAESFYQSTVSTTTNSFCFTYEAPDLVKKVYPHTYQEVMMYIDGRRHFADVMVPKGLVMEDNKAE